MKSYQKAVSFTAFALIAMPAAARVVQIDAGLPAIGRGRHVSDSKRVTVATRIDRSGFSATKPCRAGKGMMGDKGLDLADAASAGRSGVGMKAFTPAVSDDANIKINAEFSRRSSRDC